MISNQGGPEIPIESLRMGRLWVIRGSGYVFDPTGETHPPEFTRNELRAIVRDNDGRKTEMLKDVILERAYGQTSRCLP